MLKIQDVLEILKKDENFHEIVFKKEYYYNWEEDFTFDQLSYDSRNTSASTLFFAKGLNFKAEYLENLSAPFYISEIDYEVDIPAIIV